MAEHPEGPPHARGGDQPLAAVRHHAVAAADAERADRVGEGGRLGQHVRQRDRVIGDRIDVEEQRARDVGLLELGPRVAAEMRQVEGGVDHLEIGLAQVRGEPSGGDQRVGEPAVHQARVESGSRAYGLTPFGARASSHRR